MDKCKNRIGKGIGINKPIGLKWIEKVFKNKNK